MSIQPNTTVLLLGGCVLTENSENTLFFANEQEQKNYFVSLRKFDFSEQTYQRPTNDSIKVQLSITDAYKCNYIMFNNKSYEDKWFYAFITDIKYINENNTQIFYKIDSIQTWMFDYRLLECYIEREHSDTDNIGDNIVEESINIGDNVYDSCRSIIEDTSQKVVIICSNFALSYGWSVEGDGSTKKLYPHNKTDTANLIEEGQDYYYTDNILGVPCAIYYTVIPYDKNASWRIKKWVDDASKLGKAEMIVSIFCVPSYALGYHFATSQWAGEPISFDQTIKVPSTLGGYTPDNNKLFTYPYCYSFIDNGCNEKEYRFEFFSGVSKPNDSVRFTTKVALLTALEYLTIPLNYKNLSENVPESVGKTFGIELPSTINTYDNYKAQTKQAFAINTISSAISSMAGIASFGLAGGSSNTLPATVISGVSRLGSSLTSRMADLSTRGVAPYKTNSFNNQEVMSLAWGTDIYNIGVKRVTKEYAKIIDDFFTMYGYATKIVKTPSKNHRSRFWYTKTLDCAIVGDIPNTYKKDICSRYDNGIRFWRGTNTEYFGLYTIKNEIL